MLFYASLYGAIDRYDDWHLDEGEGNHPSLNPKYHTHAAAQYLFVLAHHVVLYRLVRAARVEKAREAGAMGEPGTMGKAGTMDKADTMGTVGRRHTLLRPGRPQYHPLQLHQPITL